MLVRDIILHTCRLLNLKDVETELLYESSEQSDQLKRLIRCLNMVVSEIVEEYIPQKTTEEISSQSGLILFSQLRKTPIKIYSITDTFGYPIRYVKQSNGIKVSAKKVNVTYSYTLPDLKISDSIEISLVPIRTIAYGIIAEYYILSNRYEEGIMYSKRFKGSLKNICYSCEKGSMPIRRLL